MFADGHTSHALGRLSVILAGAAASVVIVSGCGSGSDSSSGDSASAHKASPALQRVATRLESRPKRIALTQRIGKPIPTGKRIVYITCVESICPVMREGVASAAKALGWNVKTIVASPTPESIQAAFAQAIREKPDGIVSTGFSTTTYPTQMRAMAAAGIPSATAYVPDPPNEAHKYTVAYGKGFNFNEGKQMADYVIARNGTKTKAVLASLAGVPINETLAAGFQQEFKRACPSCELNTLQVPATSLGKDAASRIASFIQSKPGTTVEFATLDDLNVGLPSALRAAGQTAVKLYGSSPGKTNLQYIKTGQEEASYGSVLQEIGWQMFDGLARRMVGESPKPAERPIGEVVWTKDNLPDFNEIPAVVPDFQSQFKALWGK